MNPPPLRLFLAMIAAALLGLAAPAAAQVSGPDDGTAPPESTPPASGGDTPSPGALYETGADGKYLVGGTWLFRQDAADVGLRSGFARVASTEAWETVTVPHVWNARDISDQSMLGSIGWYRKDFQVPSDKRATTWAFRFESANYRLTAWLNGRLLGRHEGAFLPFEIPAKALQSGTNRLVLRIDSRTNAFDLPPGGPDETGRPDGGWWNYGGLPREVYMRRIEALDFDDVWVHSELPCRTCGAQVFAEARVRNTSSTSRRVKTTGTFGRLALRFAGPERLAPGRSATYRARLKIAEPSLWAPGQASLYRVRVNASDGRGARASWFERHGIRSLRVVKGGRFMLNGRPVALRGASLHEDDLQVGNALTNVRRRDDIEELRKLGAMVTRAHYPVHPYTLELADRFGILFWDQAPVYQLRANQLGNIPMRRRAVDYIERQVKRDRNHASVFSYSLVNELPARPGSGQELLIDQMARAARAMDPTRLIALDILGYPQVGPQDVYGVVDAIGVNSYFGWYPGPNGTTANRADLGPYLDLMHTAYPDKALFITEFGAEANREGPLDEKGTYAFQQDFLRYHLSVYDSRPFINGALIWILRDFRVKPGWEGGNPKPLPPINHKGLLSTSGEEKPAFAEIARIFRATRQLK
jgi:beta-glucuronidase